MTLGASLRGAGYAIDGHEILRGVDLEVRPGEFACVIGVSGSGKSTLLSLLAGLVRPTSGTVAVGDREVGPVDPRVQLVFQDGALFPWLTVAENVGFGLRARRVPRDIRRGEVDGYLRLVGLEDARDRRIHELSGGMRQRVALARALVLNPHVLLLDEPFSALDAITRATLQEEMLRLWRQTGITVILVTHNLREALLMGERVHLLGSQPGRVEASWDVPVPHGEREHHPMLRPLEDQLTERLNLAHPGTREAIA
ncbi:MAG: ABC transporter ATP-binding protein [Candidatus Dormibacteria bacterium]